ncbi:MAG TPA: hypothetical protein ENL03_04945 [Phycisphaerae bacterium]|nr:hypothetical protein [Phycisphaerae bacterium]
MEDDELVLSHSGSFYQERRKQLHTCGKKRQALQKPEVEIIKPRHSAESVHSGTHNTGHPDNTKTPRHDDAAEAPAELRTS